MRKTLILAFISIFYSTLNAQLCFETGTERDDKVANIELINDSMIVLTYLNANINDTPFENLWSKIVLYNFNGEIINEKTYEQTGKEFAILSNIVYSNYIYTGGFKRNEEGENLKYWFCKLNSNLETIWEKEYESPFMTPDANAVFQLNSENNILFSTSACYSDIWTPAIDAVMMEISLEGDLINHTLYEGNGIQRIVDILEIPESGYYIHSQGIGPDMHQRLKLDDDFNIIAYDTIPNRIYKNHDGEWLDDSSYILCGAFRYLDSPNDSIYVFTHIQDTSGTVFKSTMHKHPMGELDYIAQFNALALKDNSFFLGNTVNFDNPFVETPNWICLNNMNYNLEYNWQKYYGGDARYELSNIKLAPDGGVFLVGQVYDWNTQYNERDIFVMKVDENGLITSVNGEEFQVADAIVFPNPGTDILYIQSGFEVKEFRMMDINGRMVLQQPIHSLTEGIEVNQLPAGTYLYQIIGRDGKMQHGKWVKM